MCRLSDSWVLSIGLALLVSGVSLGQVEQAGITGTVTDPTGAAVPKAKITATNVKTQVSATTDARHVISRYSGSFPQWLGNHFHFFRRTGMPFTISTGADRSLSGPPNSDMPDQINADASRPSGANPLREYFNTAAFVGNPVAQFGDVGRDSMTAPGFWNLDMGFIKFTPVRENLKTEFRAEAFNIFNHPNFGAPVSNFSNVNFGRIQTAGNPRVLQLALKLIFELKVFLGTLCRIAN